MILAHGTKTLGIGLKSIVPISIRYLLLGIECDCKRPSQCWLQPAHTKVAHDDVMITDAPHLAPILQLYLARSQRKIDIPFSRWARGRGQLLVRLDGK